LFISEEVFEKEYGTKGMSSTNAGGPGGGGSLVSDEMTDETQDGAQLESDSHESLENELVYTEEEDNGLLENVEASEEEEHSSESSVSNPGMKKIRHLSGQGGDPEKDGSVTVSRRRQRTVSSSGGLLGTTHRREPIIRTLTRTIYTAGKKNIFREYCNSVFLENVKPAEDK
jgi:hypothetical protein